MSAVRTKRPRFLSLGMVACVATAVAVTTGGIAPAAAVPGRAQAPPSGGGARLVDVGGIAPLPAGTRVMGHLAPGTALHLVVALRPRDPAALAHFAAQVSTPGSPLYKHYVDPQDFARRFGASPAEVRTVDRALDRRGMHPGALAADRLSLPVETTAGVASAAFGTALQALRLPSGRIARAPVRPPRLPAATQRFVQGVIGLSDVALPHPGGLTSDGQRPVGRSPAGGARSAGRDARSGSGPAATTRSYPPTACSAAANQGGLTPADLSQGYQLGPVYQAGATGAGETVGLIEFAAYSTSDIATYQSCYGTNATVNTVPVDGGNSYNAATPEATVDIEDVVGMVPQAVVDVYVGPLSTVGVYDTAMTAVDDDAAKVISISYAVCEPFLTSSVTQPDHVLLEQAVSQGQTVVAASGDQGSEGCDNAYVTNNSLAVTYPASDPYVTGVGGTTLSLGPRSETTWNDGIGAGGGGISTLWPMPAWQSGSGVVNKYSSGAPCQAASGNCREVPDISANAGSGYPIYCTAGPCNGNTWPNGWQTVVGTSLSTPLVGTMVTMANQLCTTGPVGFINPLLYSLASASPGDFHDITSGNNDFTGTQNGKYPATTGYDMATGLGSPDGGNLIPALCNNTIPTATTINPASSPVAGGGMATISGAHLSGATAVDFGSVAATGVTVVSPTEVRATVPSASATGTVNVTVTTPGGTTDPIPFTYVTPAPSLTAINPASSPVTGGGTATITGTNLSAATAVDFGSTAATGVTVVSPTEVTATVPPASVLGTVQVTVTTAGGTSNGVGFVYVTPAILYTPLTPYRILDTRCAATPEPLYCTLENLPAANAGIGSLTANTPVTVQVAGVGPPSGRIPAAAQAVVANVTVVAPPDAPPGFLAVYPAGTQVPTSSNLNFRAGEAVPNVATVTLGTGGAIDVVSSVSGVDVIVDAAGYDEPAAPAGDLYSPLVPSRILDTRCATKPAPAYCAPENIPQQNAAIQPVQSGTSAAVSVKVAGIGGVVPAGATAVVLNVTVADPSRHGYLTAWPAGVSKPVVSNVNFVRSTASGNRVVVAVGAAGAVSIFISNGISQVIVDVDGYFSTSGLGLTPSAPVRICDTRPASITGYSTECSGKTIAAGTTLGVQVSGVGGVPAGAGAVVVNVTVISAAAGTGYLTLWPDGQAKPATSDVNWSGSIGTVAANMDIVQLSPSGVLDVLAASSADVVVDVVGWYS